MTRLLKTIGNDASQSVRQALNDAREDMLRRGTDILDFEKHGAFTYMNGDIAAIRNEIAKDDDALLYVYFLAALMRLGDKEATVRFSCPKKQDRTEFYDTLPLFSLLDLVPDMVSSHKKTGIPDSVTRDTVRMFENQVQDFIDLNGRYGISDYVWWMYKFLCSEIIRIGRFNFEITKYSYPYKIFKKGDKLCAIADGVELHESGQVCGSVGCEGGTLAYIEEDDAFVEGIGACTESPELHRVRLKKSEWKECLSGGERVVSVHIPTGDTMTEEICERDIRAAREIISTSYGEISAFVCHSWLLDPTIKRLFGRDTNLTKFADRFLRFPCKSTGIDVFEYVWLKKDRCSPESLSEKTSLQRLIKSHLCGGGHIYGAYGVFL